MKFLELEPHDHELSTQVRDVVLVRMRDFLDETVEPHALEETRDLAGCLVGKVRSKVAVSHSRQRVLSTQDHLEQADVIVEKEVESGIATVVVLDFFGNVVEGFEGAGGVVEVRKKSQVATISSGCELAEVVKAENALLEMCVREGRCAVAMGYRAVVGTGPMECLIRLP